MTIVAHNHPFVGTPVLAILTTAGQQVDSTQLPTTKAGMAHALAWAARRTGGDLAALWVIECTTTYGAQLTHAVAGTSTPGL